MNARRKVAAEDGAHRLHAALLGRFALDNADGTSLLPASRKQKAILAYLIYNAGSPVHRQDLVELFWPDVPYANGQGNLRAALYKIRRFMESAGDDFLTSDKVSVMIETGLCKIDLWEADGQVTIRKTAPLLDRLDPVAPTFDEWLAQERRFIAARQVARAEAVLGDESAGLDLRLDAGDAILQIDPGHEITAQIHMRNLIAAGQTSRAIKVYKRVKASLDEDGFALSAETERVFQDLRAGADSSPVSAAAPRARPAEQAQSQPQRREGRVPLLAVVPLRVHSPDPNDQFLSDVLAAELSSRLTNLREMRILGADISARLQDEALDPTTYGVDYLLTGSITVLGDQFRVSLRLTSSPAQINIWSKTIEFPAGKLSGELTRLRDAVAATVVPKVEAREHKLLGEENTENKHAYFHYLRGKSLFYTAIRYEEMNAAMQHLERAIALDPEFSPAYVNLIQALNTGAFMTAPGLPLEEPQTRAMNYTERLLALDAQDAIGHLALAWCLMRQRNFDLAEASLERAIELQPLQADRLNSIGSALLYLGRHDEAEAYFELSQRRQVQEQNYFSNDLIELHFFKRDYDQARKWLRRGNQRWAYFGQFFGAAALAQLGELAEARRAGERFQDVIKELWRGPEPYDPSDGLNWCLDVTPLRLDEDLDNLLEGLSKAGQKV